MYHYLFTNDLRVTVLDESLKKAGHCFVTNTVPPSSVDKSANNNMMTLGFYFTLNADSNCAKIAASGNARAVVLNFIKKFQFPNMRTSSAYTDSKNDGIKLAPMRVIVKLLYTMNLLHSSAVAYLTKEEIKYFIFYNDEVAKKKNADIGKLINDILEHRRTGNYPTYISTDENDHEWKHEDRQIREMLKVLQWSGCITERDSKYIIDNDGLSNQEKADVFDIITCDSFWEGTTIESYREYMDMPYEEDDEIGENDMSDEAKQVCTFDSEKCVEYVNLIVYGTPGCGKSYYVKNDLLKDYKQENIIRTTFYQDYTNTDFVGQILPTVSGDDVTYEFNPGPFTLALERAISNPQEPVALVIEELNRGNAPSIFGDIFQLLDRENGKSEYQITNVNVQKYLSDKIEDSLFEYIMIPSNLSIVATMNTSDQNVFTLDTAFKRRWDYKKLKNKFNEDHPYKDYYVPGMPDTTWETFVNSVNDFIVSASSDLQSEDKQLGVFFVAENLLLEDSTDDSDEKAEKFAYKVLEYLWDDVAKFDRDAWFNEKIKSLDELVEEFVASGKEVFKDGIFKQQNS